MVPMTMMVAQQVMQPRIVNELVAAPRQFVSAAPVAAPAFDIPPAPAAPVQQAPMAPLALPQLAPAQPSCAGNSSTPLLMALMLAIWVVLIVCAKTWYKYHLLLRL